MIYEDVHGVEFQFDSTQDVLAQRVTLFSTPFVAINSESEGNTLFYPISMDVFDKISSDEPGVSIAPAKTHTADYYSAKAWCDVFGAYMRGIPADEMIAALEEVADRYIEVITDRADRELR